MDEQTFLQHIKKILSYTNITPEIECSFLTNKICFIIKNNFEATSYLLLNIFGSIGVKFQIVPAYHENSLVELQILITKNEFQKIKKSYNN